MKSVLIFLTILLASAWADAGVLDPPLASKLAGMGPQEELSVIVHLGAQADLTQFRPEQKAEMVVELHRVADETQPSFLSRFEGKLKDVGRFWIFNGFVCTVRRKVIEELAVQCDAGFVCENGIFTLEKVERGTDPGLAGIEWNIRKVRADSVWRYRGFTGRGVVVGNIDTGVDVTHPAFGNRWRQQDGWFDAVNGYTSPYDDNGHGTHVMGTAVGCAPSDTIGVAPEATFIVAKGIDSGGMAQTSWLLYCFQWYAALSGMGMGAQVVNNSWGGSSLSTVFWQSCRNLQLLGVSLTFSVGSGMSAPANYPCVFGLGASTRGDTVASFSSRGPAPSGYPWDSSAAWLDPQWGTRQPLNHIKPDLLVPGVSIRSSYLSHGYATFDGTSIGTPHLTGAIALLMQKNPSLTPAQLWQIITSTCDTFPWGNPYPNYRYGWGRLNCLRAIDATPSGVWLEPSRLTPHASRLTVSPNPFTSFTLVPGRESERFALYDISGRRVGTYRGDRIGEGLAPGVYFIRSSGQNGKPLRVVKVR